MSERNSLEEMMDETMYNVMQAQAPEVVKAISMLLDMGQTPAKIERRIRQTRPEVSEWVRSVAEHLKRLKKQQRPTPWPTKRTP